MKSRFAYTFFLLLSTVTIFGQSLDPYKYVIVPKTYDFLKSEDQYQLNSLTKFLYEKEGFVALFDLNLKPDDLLKNPCLGLLSRVKEDSGLFSTKLTIELLNCKNEVIFTTQQGKSKEKDYKKAYQGALREAFASISALEYTYTPNKHEAMVQKQVEEKTESKQESTNERTVTPVEEVPFQVVEKDTKKEIVSQEISENRDFKDLLYAQPNALGYQLVDSTPKIVYVLLKTDDRDVFILKDRNGILIKEGDKWIVKYYEENELVIKELAIKF